MSTDARRDTYRRAQMKRWRRYVALTDQLGIPRQQKWTAHFAEIAHLERAMPEENRELWRRHRSEYHRYWLERFTLTQIHQLASGMYQDEPMPDGYEVCALPGCNVMFDVTGRSGHKKYCSKSHKDRAWYMTGRGMDYKKLAQEAANERKRRKRAEWHAQGLNSRGLPRAA